MDPMVAPWDDAGWDGGGGEWVARQASVILGRVPRIQNARRGWVRLNWWQSRLDPRHKAEDDAGGGGIGEPVICSAG